MFKVGDMVEVNPNWVKDPNYGCCGISDWMNYVGKVFTITCVLPHTCYLKGSAYIWPHYMLMPASETIKHLIERRFHSDVKII